MTTQSEHTSAAIARNACIFEMHNAGESLRDIAKEIGINLSTVKRVLAGPPAGKPGFVAEPKVTKRCLRCRKPFETTRYVFRCYNCISFGDTLESALCT